MKSYFKTLSFSLIVLSFVVALAHAIDNPDSRNYIGEFNSRAQVHEKAVNNPKNTNRGYLISYDNYQIFLDEELNSAYKILMKKLSKDRQSELKKSQRDWIKYRDSEFLLIKNNWTKANFGTSAGISRGTYRNSIVRNRVLQLLHYAKNY